MNKCEHCCIEFPDEFYNPMWVNGGFMNYCPACALLVRNRLAGLPEKTPFKGEMAQQIVEDFNEWKEKNNYGTK